MKQANILHGAAERSERANLRELKKYTKMAWDKCRSRYSSQFCREESASTRKTVKDRYSIYLEKSGIQASRKTFEQIEDYVQSRLNQLAGFNASAVETEGS